jgi:hypothetical protein
MLWIRLRRRCGLIDSAGLRGNLPSRSGKLEVGTSAAKASENWVFNAALKACPERSRMGAAPPKEASRTK